MPPDWLDSRRQLRSARIRDALDLRRDVDVTRHRDRLLERLAAYSHEDGAEFDALAEDAVDTVVSLALAEVAEPAQDQLAVVLAAVQVLAADGQFARISLLADRLRSIGHRFEVERPFLSVATQSLAFALKGREAAARRLVDERLGLGRAMPDASVARSREQLDDLLSAAIMRSVLIERDTSFAENARIAAIEVGAGVTLAFVDCVLAWRLATERAKPITVLTASDATFRDAGLQDYVRGKNLPALFPAQIAAIEGGATRDENRVISLPTSSGKTLLAEFRIAATLSRHPGTRAIYVAPYRLLARQVQSSFRQSLTRRLNLSVRDLGSGYEPTATGVLHDVVICTPERLDALLRLAGSDRLGHDEASELFSTCSVLVFDELQLLGRVGRGPRFELILSRLRIRYPSIGILGLSAATHRTNEIAAWLEAGDPIAGARRPTGTLEVVWEVDGTLKQRVARRAPTTVGSLPRTKAIDDAVALVLQLDPVYRPVLVVCVSRPRAEDVARKLAATDPKTAAKWRDDLDEEDARFLGHVVEEVRSLLGADHPLASALENGIAFHHAGVPTQVLEHIEQLAKRRILRVVSATTTVAEGADLPFRVVVIPHLNFAGSSGHLERDLYLNMIGRAGRANVSVEGIVFVLDSDARTLRGLIRTALWTDSAGGPIRGRLGEVTSEPQDVEEWSAFQEVQSQVMGWLGDGAAYVDQQAQVLADRTFSYLAGDRTERRVVVDLLSQSLASLENSGFALAASPYRLTERGHAARLTGLSPVSVSRLERAIDRGRTGWLPDLVGRSAITEELAAQMAQMAFQAAEVFEHSLYLRRSPGSRPADKLRALLGVALGEDESYLDSVEFSADVELLSAWICGESFIELARRAPTYSHASALFGGASEPKRTSDATEYIGKLTYAASWVWSAVQVLAGDLGDALPAHLRGAIELGVPTESAVGLISDGHLSRPGALAIARLAGDTWQDAVDWLTGDEAENHPSLLLTHLDRERLTDLRERLLSET